MNKIALVVAAALLVGCGGGNSVVGTVAGVRLDPLDAVLGVARGPDGKIAYSTILLVNKPALCTTLKANRIPKSATYLSIGLDRRGPSNVPLTPDVGEYTVTSTGALAEGFHATAFFANLDANCVSTTPTASGLAKSGLVKLTQIRLEANGSATGTFDITFGSDRVTGSFNGPYCEIPYSTTSPSCE